MNKLIDVFYYFKKIEYDFLSAKETSDLMKEIIDSGMPFFAGRLGATESAMLRLHEFRYVRKEEKALHQLCVWSGFFPEEKDRIPDFSSVYKEAMSLVDALCPFPYKGINFLTDQYMKKSVVFIRDFLEFSEEDHIWTRHLAGKKVLVVHPFQKTIESQYKKRIEIFKNPNILPEFDLITYKAVQTIAGEKDERFTTWFEALDYMTEEISKIEFDIALVGCGAYGFPLAARIKQMGKISVHMGGELQLLFGIKGARWDDDPFIIQKIYNEAWVYPDISEKPENFRMVEGSSYWYK